MRARLTVRQHTPFSRDVFSPFFANHQVLNKVLSVFVTLCHELALLKEEAERDIYGPLLIYGEGSSEASTDEGDSQLQFGAMLPFLQVPCQALFSAVTLPNPDKYIN